VRLRDAARELVEAILIHASLRSCEDRRRTSKRLRSADKSDVRNVLLACREHTTSIWPMDGTRCAVHARFTPRAADAPTKSQMATRLDCLGC
jgi:hypothetical protein